MTAAISLRRRDEGEKNIAAQMLFHRVARIPSDIRARTESNTRLYLKCNGIFSFVDHYLLKGKTPAFKHISLGMQGLGFMKGMPPAADFTSSHSLIR